MYLGIQKINVCNLCVNLKIILCYTSGSFEREVLRHFGSIVEESLPLEKVTRYYKQCPGVAKQVILDYVTLFDETKMVSVQCSFMDIGLS